MGPLVLMLMLNTKGIVRARVIRGYGGYIDFSAVFIIIL